MNKNPITYDHEAIQEYCRDNDWIYFGGGRHKTSFDKAKNCHFRYYKQISMDLLGYYYESPQKHFSDDRCVCGHVISQNCYIFNKITKDIVIIGNCCIRKFNLEGKTCSECGASHKNRNDNFCNECRAIKKKLLKKINICIEEGCNNKKNRYNGSYMPRCKSCWYKTRKPKNQYILNHFTLD